MSICLHEEFPIDCLHYPEKSVNYYAESRSCRFQMNSSVDAHLSILCAWNHLPHSWNNTSVFNMRSWAPVHKQFGPAGGRWTWIPFRLSWYRFSECPPPCCPLWPPWPLSRSSCLLLTFSSPPSSDPLSGRVVPTLRGPAPPHPRDNQRPCHVCPQALRQDQPWEGESERRRARWEVEALCFVTQQVVWECFGFQM